ncbi:hypothetical protein D623_10019287 [Myotis brandtii]|uniref:Uncharacterized protein n=1 Tax=Myotis brandtii TaxID=109478 RepID=S7NIM3_MYOBR|nr:hypothetical protein D623_10019287 [Myotis brandtii]
MSQDTQLGVQKAPGTCPPAMAPQAPPTAPDPPPPALCQFLTLRRQEGPEGLGHGYCECTSVYDESS